jgi:hypothetical protein
MSKPRPTHVPEGLRQGSKVQRVRPRSLNLKQLRSAYTAYKSSF